MNAPFKPSLEQKNKWKKKKEKKHTGDATISNLQAHLFRAVPTAAVGTAVTDVANEAKTGVLLSNYKIDLKKCYNLQKERRNLQLAARDVSRLEPSATAAAAATVAPAAVPAVVATAVAIAAEGVW